MTGPSTNRALEQQVRHRSAARPWPVLWGTVATLAAVPFAALLTPLAFLGAALAVRALDLLGLPGIEPVIDALRGRPGGPGGFEPFGMVTRLEVAILVVPGLAAGLWVWRRVSALFEVGGRDGVVALFDTRAPRRDDAAERWLLAVVEEAARRAVTVAPEVRIVEGAGANAAAAGSSAADAVVVVTRGALDPLDPPRLRALVFQRVAAIAAGDLPLITAALAVQHTLGFLAAAGDSILAWSPAAWRRLAVLVRSPRRDRVAASRTVAALLASEPTSTGCGLFPLGRGEPSAWRRALDRQRWLWAFLVPLAPLFLAWVLYRGYLHLLRVLLVEPMVMLVLRGRCHRADLLAAELLDDVAALTSMLDRPRGEIAVLAGRGRLDPLFTVAPVRSSGSGFWSGRSGELSPHPNPERRVARLQGRPPSFLPAQAQGAPLVGLALMNVILLGGFVLVTLVSYLYAAVCALTAWIAASGLALVGRLLL